MSVVDNSNDNNCSDHHNTNSYGYLVPVSTSYSQPHMNSSTSKSRNNSSAMYSSVGDGRASIGIDGLSPQTDDVVFPKVSDLTGCFYSVIYHALIGKRKKRIINSWRFVYK